MTIEKTIAEKPLTKKEAGRAEAIEILKKWLKPGDTVYTILRHVSASGMSRSLDVLTIRNNKPLRLTWSAATALGTAYDRKIDAIRVSSVGEDAGFSTVYHLSLVLFGDGYALTHRWL
jgi:hypothetical protein